MGVNDWNKHIKENFLESNVTSSIILSKTLIWKSLGLVKRLIGEQVSEFSEVSEVSEEYGDYYSKQNNSLEKIDVRSFMPERIDPEYELMVNKISTRCNKNKYICFFLNHLPF